MKKCFLLVSILVLGYCSSYSQLYMTRSGFIGFYSKTPFEDIKAENNQVYAVFDTGKKSIAFTLLVKSFIFRKELMQEHFNENYAESDKFPKASFTGIYSGEVLLNKDGKYTVAVKGNLTFHNVTKEINVTATLEVKTGKLIGHSQFKLMPEEYNISIPSIVRDKIAKEVTVEVLVDCNTIK